MNFIRSKWRPYLIEYNVTGYFLQNSPKIIIAVYTIKNNYKVFLHLYKALVRSILEYGNAVWSPHKMKHIELLESVQRRATRTVPELKGLSYEDRLRTLNLPTLVYRRLRGDMIEAFKIVQNIYDPKVAPVLSFRENSTLRGHSKTLSKSRCIRKLRSNCFTQRITNSWNSLPENVISAPSVNAFKNRLDKLWNNQEVKFNYKATLQPRKYTKCEFNAELDIEEP